MQRTRITFSVSMDLDAVPGSFHEAEDAMRRVEHMLNQAIPHYHPVVDRESLSTRDTIGEGA